MNLPETPGLERRLAYSQYIRQQNNSQNRFRLTRRNAISIVGRNIYQNYTDTNGISLANLFNKSEIYLTENFDCPICQDPENENTIIRKLKCNHEFHIYCIERWLCKEMTCPICRINLSFD
jgi:hypothetical protein